MINAEAQNIFTFASENETIVSVNFSSVSFSKNESVQNFV